MRYGPESKLAGVNNGWHEGDGPMYWDVRTEVRFAEDGQSQVHLVCAADGQSVFCLAPQAFLPGFTVDLVTLKARVADHVLKCHSGEIAALTYR